MKNRNQRVLLRSAVRTIATATSSVTNAVTNGNTAAVGPSFEYECHTARFYLNVTAASGTGGLTFQLRGWDKASNTSVVLAADTAPITATGLYVFEVAPSIAAASGVRRVAFNAYLPVQWDVNIAVGDASSYTYSLSMETTS